MASTKTERTLEISLTEDLVDAVLENADKFSNTQIDLLITRLDQIFYDREVLAGNIEDLEFEDDDDV